MEEVLCFLFFIYMDPGPFASEIVRNCKTVTYNLSYPYIIFNKTLASDRVLLGFQQKHIRDAMKMTTVTFRVSLGSK